MADQIKTTLSAVKPTETVIEITDESKYVLQDYLTGEYNIHAVGQDIIVVPKEGGGETLKFASNVVYKYTQAGIIEIAEDGTVSYEVQELVPGQETPGTVNLLSDGSLGLSLYGLGIGDGLGYSGLLGYGDMGLGGSGGLAAFNRGAGDFGGPLDFVDDVFTYKLVSIGQPYGSNLRTRDVVPGQGLNGEIYENQEFSLKVEGIADALNSVAPSGNSVYLNLYLKSDSKASAADFDFSHLVEGQVLPMEGSGGAWIYKYDETEGVITIRTIGWKDGSATYVNLWTDADNLLELDEAFEFGLEINQILTGEIIDDGAAKLIAMESQTGTIIDQPYVEPWTPGDPGDPTNPEDPGEPGKPGRPVDPKNPDTGSVIGFALRPMDTASNDQYNYKDDEGNLRYPGLQVEEGGELVLSIATSGATLGMDVYLELNMFLNGGLVLGGDFDKTTPDASADDIDWAGITSTTPGVEIYTDGDGKIVVKVPAGFEAGSDINIVIPTVDDAIIESLEDVRFDLSEELFSGSIDDINGKPIPSVNVPSDILDNIVFEVEDENGNTIINGPAEGQIADKITDPEGPTDPDKPGVDGEALNVWLEPVEANHKTSTNLASESGSSNAEFGIRMDGVLAENTKLGLSLVLKPSDAHPYKTSADDIDMAGIAITLSDGTKLQLVPQSQYDSSVHDGYYFVDGENIQINFTVSGAAADEIIVSVPAQKDNEIEPAEYFEADLSQWAEGTDSGLKPQDGAVVVKDADATGVIVDHEDPDKLDTYDYEVEIDPSEVKENNELTVTITGKGTDNDGDGTHANAPEDIPIFIDVTVADPNAEDGFASPDDFDWSNINEGDQLPVYDKDGNVVDDATAWVESVNPDTGEITIGTQGWDHDNHVDLTLVAKDDAKVEPDEGFTVDVGVNTDLTDDVLDGVDENGEETDDPARVTADDEAEGTVIDDGTGEPGEGDRIEFSLNPLDESLDVDDTYDGVQVEENEAGKTDSEIVLSVSSKGLDSRDNEVDGMELGAATYLLFEMVDPSDTSGRANVDDIDWENASITDAEGNPIDGAQIYADGDGTIVVKLPNGFEAGEDFQVHLPVASDDMAEGLESFEFELKETIDMPSFENVVKGQDVPVGETFDKNNSDSLSDNIVWADENDIAEGDIIDEVVDPVEPPEPKEPDADQLVFELQPSSADNNIASEYKDENQDAIFTIELNDEEGDGGDEGAQEIDEDISYGDLAGNASVGLTLVLKPSEDQKYTANMEKDIDLDNISLTMFDKAGAELKELAIASKEDYDADPSAYDGYYFFNEDGHIQLNFIVSDMVKGGTIDVRVPAVQDNVIEVDEYFEAELSHWDEGSSDGLKAADNGVKIINNDAEAKIVDANEEGPGGEKHEDSYEYEIIEAGPKDDPSANEIEEGDSLVVVIGGKGTDNDNDGINSDGPEDIPVYIDVDIKEVAGGADPDDFDFSALKPGDPIPVTDENGDPAADDAKAWVESVDPDTGVITVGTENWDHNNQIELEIPVVDEVTLPGEEEGDEDYVVEIDINDELTEDELDGGDGTDPRVDIKDDGGEATGVIKDQPEDHLSFNLLPLGTATDDEREGVAGYEGVQVEEGGDITLAIASSGVALEEGSAYLEINLDGKAVPEDFDWSTVAASYDGEPLNVYADGNGKLVVEIPEGFEPSDSNIELTLGVAEDDQIEGLEDFTFTLEEEPFTGNINYVNNGGGQASLTTNPNAGIIAKDSEAEGAIVDKVTDPIPVDPTTPIDPSKPIDPDKPLEPVDPDGKDNLALRVELEAITADHATEVNVASEADQNVQSSFFINFVDGNLAEGVNLGLSLVLSPVYEKTDEKGNLLSGQHAAEVAQDIDYGNITLVLILKDGTVKQITGDDLAISINKDGNIQIDFKVSGVPEGSQVRVNVPAAHDNEIEVAEYFEAELSHWSEGSDLGLKAVDGAVDVINNNATGVIVDNSDEDNGGSGSTDDSYKFEIIEVGVDGDPNTPTIEIKEGDNLEVTIQGKGTDNDGDGEEASAPSDVPIYIDVSIEDVTGGANPDDFDFSGFKPGDPITVMRPAVDENGNPIVDGDGNPVLEESDSEAWVEAVDPDTGTITVGAKDWDHEDQIKLEIPVLKDGDIEGSEDGKVTVDVNDELTDDELDGGDGEDPRVDVEGEDGTFEIVEGSDEETIDFVLRSIVDTDTHYYEGTQIEETQNITLYVGTSAHKNITETDKDIFLEINMINPSSEKGKANLDDIDWTGVTASFVDENGNTIDLNIYATAEGKLILEIPAGFNPRLGPALGEDIKINLPTLDNNDGIVEGLEEFVFEMTEVPFSGGVDYVNNGGGSISVTTEQDIADMVDYTLTDNGDLDPERGTTNEQAIGEIIDIVTDPLGPVEPEPGDPDGSDDKAVRLELVGVKGEDNIAYEAVDGDKTEADHANFTIKLASNTDKTLATNATLGLRLILKPINEETEGHHAAEMGTSAADSDIDIENIKIVLADGTELGKDDFVLKFINVNGEDRIQIDFKLTGGIGNAGDTGEIKIYIPARQDGEIEAREFFEVDLEHWDGGSDDGLKAENKSVEVIDNVAEGQIFDHKNPDKLDEFDYLVDILDDQGNDLDEVDEGDEITVRITGDGTDNDGDGIASAPDDIPVYIDVNFVDPDGDVEAKDFDFDNIKDGETGDVVVAGDPVTVYDKDGNIVDDATAWVEAVNPDTGEVTVGTQGWDDGYYVDLTVPTEKDNLLEDDEDFTVTTDINTDLTDDAIDGIDKDGNPVDTNNDGVIDENDKPRVDATGEDDATIIEGDSGIKFGLSLDDSTVDASSDTVSSNDNDSNYGGVQVEERPETDPTSANNIVLSLTSTVDPALAPDGVVSDKPVYLVIKMDTAASDLDLGGDYSNENDASLDDIAWSEVTIDGVVGAKIYVDETTGTLVVELPVGYDFDGGDLKISLPVKYDTEAEGLEDFRFELQDSLDDIPSFKDAITGEDFSASNELGGIGFEAEADRQADGQLIDNNDKIVEPEGGLAVELVPVDADKDSNIAYEVGDGTDDDAVFQIRLNKDSEYTLADDAQLGLSLILKPSGDIYAAEMSDIDMSGIMIVLADGSEVNLVSEDQYDSQSHGGYYFLNSDGNIQVNFSVTGGLDKGSDSVIKVYVPAVHDNQIEPAEYFEADLSHWDGGSDNGLKTTDNTVSVTDAGATGKIIDNEGDLDDYTFTVDEIKPSNVDEGDTVTVVIKGEGTDVDGDGTHASAPDDIPVYIDVNLLPNDADPDDFDWSAYEDASEDNPVEIPVEGGGQAWVVGVDPDTGTVTVKTEDWEHESQAELELTAKDDVLLEPDEDFTIGTEINTDLTDDAIDGVDENGNKVDSNGDGVIDENDQRVDGDETGKDGTIIDNSNGIEFNLKLDETTVDGSDRDGVQVEEQTSIVLNLSSTIDTTLIAAGTKADKPVYLVINMDTASSDLVLGGDYSNENDASLADIDWTQVTIDGVEGAKIYADGNGKLVVELPAGYQFDGGDDLLISLPVLEDNVAEGLEDFRFELEDYSTDPIDGFTNVISGGDNFAGSSNELGGISAGDKQADGQLIDNNDAGAGLKLELVSVDADKDSNIAYEVGDGTDDDAVFTIKLASDSRDVLSSDAQLGLSLILKPTNGDYAAEMGSSAADSDIDVANIKIILSDGTELGKDDFVLKFITVDGEERIQIDFIVTGGLDKGQNITVKVPAVHDNQIEATEYFEVDLVHWDEGSDNGLQSSDGTVSVTDADATGKIIDNEGDLDDYTFTVDEIKPSKVDEGDTVTVVIKGEGTDVDGDGTHASAPDDIPVYIDVNLLPNDADPDDFDWSAYDNASEDNPVEIPVEGGGQAWVVGVDPDTGTVTVKTEDWEHESEAELELTAKDDVFLEPDEDFTIGTEINTDLTDDAIDGVDENGNKVDSNGDGVIDENDQRVDGDETGKDGTIIDNSDGIEFNLKLDETTVDGSDRDGVQVEEQTNIVLNLSSTIDTTLIAAGTKADQPVYLVINMDTASSDLVLGGDYSNENDASLADIDWTQVTIDGVDGAKIYADGNGKLVVELPAGYQFDGGDDLLISLPVLEDNVAEGLEDFRFELEDYSTDPIGGFTNVISGGDNFAGSSNELGGISAGDKQADGQLIDNNDAGAGLKLELKADDGENNIAKEGSSTGSQFTIKLASDSRDVLAAEAELGLSLIIKPIAEVDADNDGNMDRWSAEMGTNKDDSDIDVEKITITLASGDTLTYANGDFTIEFVDGNIKINFTVEGGLGRTDEIKVNIPAREDYQLEAQEYFEVDLVHWDEGSDNGLQSSDGTVSVADAEAFGKITDADERNMFQFEVIKALADDDNTTTTDKVEVKEGTDFKFTIKGQSVDKDGKVLTTGHDAPEDIPLYIKVSLADLGLADEATADDFDWTSVSIDYNGSGSASITGFVDGHIIIETLAWDHGDTATITLPVNKEENETAIEGNEDFVLTPEIDGKTDDAFEDRVDISGDESADGVDAEGNITGEILDVSDAKFRLEFNNLTDVKVNGQSQDQREYTVSAFYGGVDIEESTNVVLGINATGVKPNKGVYVKLYLKTDSSVSNSANASDFDWTSVKLDNMPAGFAIYANNDGEMVLKIPAEFDPTSSGTEIRISIDIKDDGVVESRESFIFGMEADQYNGEFVYVNNGGGTMTADDQLDSSYVDINSGKLANGNIMDEVTDGHTPAPTNPHKPVDPNNLAGDDNSALYVKMEDVDDADSHIAQYKIALTSDSAGNLADGATFGLSLLVHGVGGFDLTSSTVDLGNIVVNINGQSLKLVSGSSVTTGLANLQDGVDGQYYIEDGVLRIDFQVSQGWNIGTIDDANKGVDIYIPLKDGSVVAANNIQASLEHWSQGSDEGLYASDDAVVIEQSGNPNGGEVTILDGIKEFENQTILGREQDKGTSWSAGSETNPLTFNIQDSDFSVAGSSEVVEVTAVTVKDAPSFILATQTVTDGAGIIYGKYGVLTIYDGKKSSGDTDAGGEYSYRLYTEDDRSILTGNVASGGLGLKDAEFDELLAGIEALDTGDEVQDEFTYTLKDKAGGTGTGQIVVKITGENDAPILTGASNFQKGDVSTYAGTETDGVLVIPKGAKLTISDADDDKINKLIVSVIGTDTTGDVLSYMDPLPSGITLDPSSTATKRVFVASAGASYDDFLDVIHSIKYKNSNPDNMVRGERQIKFEVFDDDESLDHSSSFDAQFGSDDKVAKPDDFTEHENADSVWIQNITFQGAPSGEDFTDSVIEFENQTILTENLDTEERLELTRLLNQSIKITDPDFAAGDTVSITSITRDPTLITSHLNMWNGFQFEPITESDLPDISLTPDPDTGVVTIYGMYGMLTFNKEDLVFSESNQSFDFNYALYTRKDMDEFIRACGGEPDDKYINGTEGREAYKTFITILMRIDALDPDEVINEVFSYSLKDESGLPSSGNDITINIVGDERPFYYGPVPDAEDLVITADAFTNGQVSGDFKMLDPEMEMYQQNITVEVVGLFAVRESDYDENDKIKDGNGKTIDVYVLNNGLNTIKFSEILAFNDISFATADKVYGKETYNDGRQEYAFGLIDLASDDGTGTIYGVFGKLEITDGHYDIHGLSSDSATVGQYTGKYGTGSYTYTLYSESDRADLEAKFKAVGSTDAEAKAKANALLDYITSGQAAADGAEDWFRLGVEDDSGPGSLYGSLTFEVPDASAQAAPTPAAARMLSDDVETVIASDNDDNLTISHSGLFEVNGGEGQDLLKLIGASDAVKFNTHKKDQTIKAVIDGESVEVQVSNVERIEFEETIYEWSGREWVVES